MNSPLKIQKLGELDIPRLLNRNTQNQKAMDTVKEILENVKLEGVEAVLRYTEKFDGVKLTETQLRVTEKEIEEAYSKLSKNQISVIRDVIKRVKRFCLRQRRTVKETVSGGTKLRWLPLRRAGIYVPAGNAPLASSLIMSAIPAMVAGVNQIVVCSPPGKDGKLDPSILVAAKECGLEEVYKIGGAQAIGAMAYGCKLFEKVDVISGPGNIYVACAKQQIAAAGLAKIDVNAGPTELLVIADGTANPKLIAADMLAQAEHGETSSSICLTTCKKTAEEIKAEVEAQLAKLPNQGRIASALQNFGALVVVDSIEDAINFANRFAPEHVEVFAENQEEIAERITEAGAVFVGTSEVFGDYGMTDANHILPTGQAGKFSSGVNIYTFLKCQYVQKLERETEGKLAKRTAEFARMERLEAHARAAEAREI